jgi:hypothetical protein
MNTPINFEIAKLLKEKDFQEKSKSYNDDGKLITVSLSIRKFNPEKTYYPAPTIAEVVMWLYEKHEIWISINKLNDSKFFINIVLKDNTKIIKGVTVDDVEFRKVHYFNSPTEAYEAAIEYTLNNLI